jgi:hypothetical protein
LQPLRPGEFYFYGFWHSSCRAAPTLEDSRLVRYGAFRDAEWSVCKEFCQFRLKSNPREFQRRIKAGNDFPSLVSGKKQHPIDLQHANAMDKADEHADASQQ